ncbi:MAG: nucleotidyltransferase family protein [Thermoleophilaceae bacterium]
MKLPWDPVEAAGVGLAVQAAAAEAEAALREAGVPSILLKGPSFEGWLYDADEPRMYGDVDLLVDARQFEQAGGVLAGLGYAQRSEERAPTHVDHAKLWLRAEDHMHLDLHRSLVGAGVAGADVWTVLTEHTEPMEIVGGRVDILSEPARAMQVALHAVVHGHSTDKTLLELSRAIERVPVAAWEQAAGLAGRIGADGAFTTGLRMTPEGGELADRLGLTATPTVENVMFAEEVPYSSWTVNRLANTPGVVAKLRIVLQRVFPSPEFMRAWYPIARRGPIGLALSYPRRLAWMVRATGPAVAAWWRARRRARTP